ncbi:MAG: hypothetical protein JOZ40_24760, partial [Methylobacteriaceae bacterium]|nr:hypothetical protein [Methylobacteriaceae bacterium]
MRVTSVALATGIFLASALAGPPVPVAAQGNAAGTEGFFGDAPPGPKPPAKPPEPPKPPPPKPPEPLRLPSLYDMLYAGDVSPRGTAASSVDAENLADEATGFLEGSGGKPRDEVEAAYWLRRAITQSAADTAARASSLTRLGSLYAESKRDTLSARVLWQIAGALGNFDALCDLGNLATDGDKVSKPDP